MRVTRIGRQALMATVTIGTLAVGVVVAGSSGSGSGVPAKAGAGATDAAPSSPAPAMTTMAAPLLTAGAVDGFAALAALPAVTDARIAEKIAVVPKEKLGAADGERRAWVLREVDGVAYMAVAIGNETLCYATASVELGKLGGMGCSPMKRALDPGSGTGGVDVTKERSFAHMIVSDDVAAIGLLDEAGTSVEAAVSGNFAIVEMDGPATWLTFTTLDGATSKVALPPPVE
jgi:hypothetical protein